MKICTIVIPTHNREGLLIRAVRSALKACPVDGEVLVVDDKSVVPAEKVLSAVKNERLRIIVNSELSGAATTRNLGVASALGDVIFFLDDDDEIVKDYCDRVLSGVVSMKNDHQWGFSSTIERRGDLQVVDSLRIRKRLSPGMVPVASSPRDLVAAMSDGFWIRRQLFLEVGGLDPEQTIDEDTDLCMRLLASSRLPWYELVPGMIVYRDYSPARIDGAQLTVATPIQRGLECYRRTHDKNVHRFDRFSRMRWFLVTRFVRKAVKAGEIGLATELIGSLHPTLFRLGAWVFFCLKRMAHRGRSART